MSGGGGGGTTNTTATPWSGIQPFLNNFYSNAQNAWNNGQIAPAQNTGQIAQWSQDTSNSYQMALQGGGEANALAQQLASGNFSQNVGAQGLQGLISGNFAGNTGQTLQGIANGSGGVAGQTLNNWANGQFGGNAATAGLLSTANGANLNPNNAALQGEINAASQPVVQNFQQATLPGLLSAFSANGRTGSGAEGLAVNQASTALGQQLSNLSGTLTGNWMQNALQQQQAAQQSLAGLSSGSAGQLLGGQLQAGSTLGGLASGASANLGSLQGNAISAIPGISSSNLNTSGVYQNYLQSILNSQINQQNFNNTLPLQALQNMEGLLNPGLSLSGSTTQSSQNSNPFGMALGGAATGAALGSVVPGVGTAIGAGVGGLAGLLGGML